MEEKLAIVGLGNPGKEYEDTRHNIGFRLLKKMAKERGVSFQSALFRAKGSITEIVIEDEKILLLLPMTYMNESGMAVKRCLKNFSIPPSGVIIVVDDVDLPFGQLRLREQGSAGGHNGLKSIEAHLGTQEYWRLRIGVGRPPLGQDLAEYVLEAFSQEEEEELPEILNRGEKLLIEWMIKRKKCC